MYRIVLISTLWFMTNCTQEKKISLPPKEVDSSGLNAAEKPTPPHFVESKSTPPQIQEAVSKKSQEYRLSGEVTALRKSQIAFRVGGFIDQVKIQAGKMAKKGEVLASLDDRDFILRLELSRARRDQAKIALILAEKEFAREQQLQGENASTATMFDKVKAGYDQAKIALKLSEIDVQSSELALHQTKLLAPYDCVVAVQMKHEGENVQLGAQGGAAIFEVYDLSEPEVSLSAPERLISSMKIGTILNITIPSVGFSGKAEIVRMVPVISERTRTFQVIAKISKYDSKIVPGSYAEATIE